MFEKLIEGIKHYKNSTFDREAYLARIKALPKDYQIVYNGISDYMWSSGAGGAGVMETLCEVLAAFEDGTKDKRDVFSITGENTIEFADGLLHELPGKTWMDKIKEDKNKSIVDAVKRNGEKYGR
jgi:DNA-binding ferritin-like protein (Dps family)